MPEIPKISICIPAYNRAEYLAPLLHSIFKQTERSFEVVICEDDSPERDKISNIVREFQNRYPNFIRYYENNCNFGYDGNLRELIRLSKGHFCLFLGNDDLLNQGALSSIETLISRHDNCGVIIRSYATFDHNTNRLKQIFRYFPEEKHIKSGENAIVAAYRRSVVIPGMTIHRETSLKFATSEFDGTLLYQLYLVGCILSERDVIFTPKIVAFRRDGVAPDFGNSDVEKGLFTPKQQTVASSLHFIEGMLKIAQHLEEKFCLNLYKPILLDISSYSYPILAIQASRSKLEFARYVASLSKRGLARSPFFFIYASLLFIFSSSFLDKIIVFVKSKLGHTPLLVSAIRRQK